MHPTTTRKTSSFQFIKVGSRSMAVMTAIAALSLSFGSEAHAQAAPCGNVGFTNGMVTLERALPTTMPLTDEVRNCLSSLAAKITERAYLRSVTVIVRLADDDRLDGKALTLANAIRDELRKAGAPARKISAVAPAIGHGQSAGVQLVYSERRRERIVARIDMLMGTVSAGRDSEKLTKTNKGATLHEFDYVQTGTSSRALIRVADGSTLLLQPSSLLRFGNIGVNDKYQRTVKLTLTSGSMYTNVAKGKEGSTFHVITRAAVAGVRGTDFRTTVQPDGYTRIETATGSVDLGNPSGTVNVAGGFGSRVMANQAPEAPRPLLPATGGLRPVQGRFSTPPSLTWASSPGAASYVVEYSTDAQFRTITPTIESTSTSATLPAGLAEGRWFWRVRTVDSDGFIGMPSKIYAFTIDQQNAAQPDATDIK